MKTIKYILLYLLGIALLFSSCENSVDEETDQASIALSGITPKNDGSTGTNIYLKAFLSGAPQVYLGETLIRFSSELSTTPQNVIFPSAIPYYPIGGSTINFFAYTGKLSTTAGTNDRMIVLAGNGSAYDAILSNQGEDFNNLLSPEGFGTPGSSVAPAKILHFRHVMTQLVVNVEVNNVEVPDTVSPPPTSMQFTMDGVAARGLYAIRASSPVAGAEATYADTAHTTSGRYTISLGTNYLVANGTNLVNRHLKSLKIDDYTATPADLANFTIQPQPGSTDLRLLPGYSYNLTFMVSRLKVTGVKVRLIPWQAHELTPTNPDYNAYSLNLSLGGAYNNTGADLISKVILHTTDKKMYVGESTTGGSSIPFVTLPAGNVDRADLYTKKGLLISTPITNEYQYTSGSGNLNIANLSVGGMLPENPSLPYNSTTNPYLITTALQFVNVNKDLTASYKQRNIIDLDLVNDAGFNGFGAFSGTYDGNGYWISKLGIQATGLFASNSGVLKNIRIFSGTIDATGQPVAGGICGTNTGTIVACFNEAEITNATIAGGIAGSNSGLVLASINTGNILQGSTVGGIVGSNSNTSEGAIAACLNIGSLSKDATMYGGICGTSTASLNNVLRTSYWLIGSAAGQIGEYEFAVGSRNIGIYDCTAVDPDKMRNGLDPGESADKRIINRLNVEIIRYTQWSPIYNYIIDREETGSTWPTPVKK